MTHEEGYAIAQQRVDNFERGDLDLSYLNLTKLPDMSHFVYVNTLYVDNNALSCLKGCPAKVRCFFCNDNKLTSLEYSPICDRMVSYNNDIKNLEHYRTINWCVYDKTINCYVYDDNPTLTNHYNLLHYYKLDHTDIKVWRYYEKYFNS